MSHPPIPVRALGSQGLAVAAIGYGAMGITNAYGPSDPEEGIRAIQRAHDLGVTMFDTAEVYSWGENERVLGRAVRGFRDEVVIATKFGFTPDGGLDSRPNHIREVVDASLQHLGTQTIDLLYQHRVDPDVPIEDVAGAVAELVEAGKVKYFGLSEAGPQTIRRAHAVHAVSAVQMELSLFERDVEAIYPALDELGVGLVAYSPLGRGFLSGTTHPASHYGDRDMRRYDLRWQPGNYERNLAAVGELRVLAEARNATVAQLALAWVLAQRDDVVPIPGTRDIRRLEENIGAAALELDAADLDRIAEILPNGGVGGRYLPDMMPTWD